MPLTMAFNEGLGSITYLVFEILSDATVLEIVSEAIFIIYLVSKIVSDATEGGIKCGFGV